MSALARYFNFFEKKVYGYDKTSTTLTTKLEEEGIEIHFKESLKLLTELAKKPEETLFVYTPAISEENIELIFIRQKKISIRKRSEVLGMIASTGDCIAIAGTHGKTTTSSMVAHIFTHSGFGCNAFVGGIMTNYQSNLLLDNSSSTYVIEADEFDRSFLALHPNLAVITSMDADHLDIYGETKELEKSFNLFAQQIKENGALIIKEELKENVDISANKESYSIVEKATYQAKNIRIIDGYYHFDFHHNQKNIYNIRLGLAGRHNVENAVAAVAIATKRNIDPEKIKKALESYRGVKRRFERVYTSDKVVFIDDYAHHPTELTATIQSVKEIYPNKKITGIFQPHLYSRTRDFIDEFVQSIDLLDDIILLPIYPAREKPITGIDSQLILNKLKTESKTLMDKSELLYELKGRHIEVLLTLGAGDIDTLVLPIKKIIDQ